MGEAVNKLAKKNIFQVEERIEVYDQARDLLLSTPGHAEYYRDRINEARLKMENSRGDAGDYPYYKNKLREVILYDFPIFEQLPSPETVRVLGEFLFDERGYVRVDNPKDENELFKMIAQGPVFGRAARSLLALPLEHKPVVDTRYPSYTNPEDILPWRQWIEEIKAGKRTFRFVGDPTEYDLNGPASQEKLTRLAMNRERDEERAVGHNRPSSAPEAESAVTRIGKPSTIAGILAGCALVAAAVWYFLRGRKTA